MFEAEIIGGTIGILIVWFMYIVKVVIIDDHKEEQWI